MEKILVSIVIPVLNEKENLEFIKESVVKNIKKLKNIEYEIIFVDDGSKDGSWELIKKIAERDRSVKGIRFSRNFGKESAIIAGLENSKGDAVIVIDSDGQHPPEKIPEMIKLWKEKNVEIVECIKLEREKENLFRRLGAIAFYKILKTLAGFELEGKSDYKLLDRRVVDCLLQLKERNLFFRGITEWTGFKKVEISFVPSERKQGKSRWSFLKVVRYAINNIVSFSSIPLHFVTIAGVIFLFFSVLLGVQTLFMKFTGKAVSGFTTVILLLLIIGSLLMISLGIIGEYIAKIYEEIKGRPRYVIKETYNIKEH